MPWRRHPVKFDRPAAMYRPATFPARSTVSSPTSTPRNIASGTRSASSASRTSTRPPGCRGRRSRSRRYCNGTAVINGGARHPLFYSIAEDTDIDGFGWGINFCVDGLDRNGAYNPHCRSAKP